MPMKGAPHGFNHLDCLVTDSVSPTPFSTVTLANLYPAKHRQQGCVLSVLTAWVNLVLLA